MQRPIAGVTCLISYHESHYVKIPVGGDQKEIGQEATKGRKFAKKFASLTMINIHKTVCRGRRGAKLRALGGHDHPECHSYIHGPRMVASASSATNDTHVRHRMCNCGIEHAHSTLPNRARRCPMLCSCHHTKQKARKRRSKLAYDERQTDNARGLFSHRGSCCTFMCLSMQRAPLTAPLTHILRPPAPPDFAGWAGARPLCAGCGRWSRRASARGG